MKHKLVIDVIKELQERVKQYGDDIVCWGWDDGSIVVSSSNQLLECKGADIECYIEDKDETNS